MPNVSTVDKTLAQIPVVTAGDGAHSTPVPTVQQGAASGGSPIYSFLSTNAVQAANIKASPGQVYGLHFFNNSATIAYVRLYNQTGVPGAADTANIVYRAMIPANTSGAGFVIPIPPGTPFTLGIGIRVTAAVADNDNTALAANAVMGNVFSN